MPDAAGLLPIGSQLDPQSVAAAGSATGAYSDTSLSTAGPNYVALCSMGAGTGSCAFSIVQAKDSSGTGVKAISAASTLTLGTASTNGTMDVEVGDLDSANGFKFIAIKVTVTGGAGTLVGGTLVSCSPKYAS